MDFSRWTREKSIIAPSVKKYRVYTPIGGVKKRNYTPDGKNHFLTQIFCVSTHPFSSTLWLTSVLATGACPPR